MTLLGPHRATEDSTCTSDVCCRRRRRGSGSGGAAVRQYRCKCRVAVSVERRVRGQRAGRQQVGSDVRRRQPLRRATRLGQQRAAGGRERSGRGSLLHHSNRPARQPLACARRLLRCCRLRCPHPCRTTQTAQPMCAWPTACSSCRRRCAAVCTWRLGCCCCWRLQPLPARIAGLMPDCMHGGMTQRTAPARLHCAGGAARQPQRALHVGAHPQRGPLLHRPLAAVPGHPNRGPHPAASRWAGVWHVCCTGGGHAAAAAAALGACLRLSSRGLTVLGPAVLPAGEGMWPGELAG